MTSQILQIVALLVAWVFWGLFFLGFITMVMQQLLWCCRQTKTEVLVSTGLSMVGALLAIWSGVYVLLNQEDPEWCRPIFFWSGMGVPDWEDLDLDCGGDHLESVTTKAFCAAALWLASAACSMTFVKTGRHSHWERRCDDDSGNHNKSKNRAVNWGKDNDAGVDEIFDPTSHTHNHSERTESRRSACAISKSEQFDPPEDAYDFPL